MSEHQIPKPKIAPEIQDDRRKLGVSDIARVKPAPETGKRPRYVFSDFASI
ncbi:hypothetical protein [Tropicimonas sp.]|uniref:hypothetical protein n=1 Tax=Tropicimonas sp. TaxID=2067044 RepID=UPI003A8BE546